MTARPTTMNEHADRRNWLIAGSVAALLAAPLFVMAHGSSSDERQEVRAHLAKMTATERQRLERNFEQFQQLAPEELAKIRELHQNLEQDPDLKNVLTAYYEWFKTRSTWERYELRPGEETAKRVARVHDMLAREQERRGGYSENWRKKNTFGPRMADEDVAPVLTAFQNWINDQAEQGRSELLGGRALPERLDELPELQRHIHLLRKMVFVLRAQSLPGNSENALPLQDWIKAMPSDELREFLLKCQEDEQRRLVPFKLNIRLWDEYFHEYRKVRPTDEELKQFLLSLKREQQDRYLSLPPHEFEHDLRKEYIRARLPDIHQTGEELRNLSDDIRDSMRFAPRWRADGNRRSNTSSDGERRSPTRGRSGSRGERPSSSPPSRGDDESPDRSD